MQQKMTSKITDNSFTNNTNNTSEMERSKKSRKVSHNATTPYSVNRQQQQQNRLFFNNYPENDMCYKEVLPGNTSYSGMTQSGKKVYIFGTSMVSNVKHKNSTINSEVFLHVFETLEVPP